MPLIVTQKELPHLQAKDHAMKEKDCDARMLWTMILVPLAWYCPQRLPWRPSPKAGAPQSPDQWHVVYMKGWEELIITWPSLSRWSSQSSWQRGGVLATWFGLRLNSNLKSVVDFTGSTVDIRHSLALLTTCGNRFFEDNFLGIFFNEVTTCISKWMFAWPLVHKDDMLMILSHRL